MPVYPLRGVVQHYPWGGNSFIPSLLNIHNDEGKPFAEYWLGGHDNAPSEVVLGQPTALNLLISRQPDVLGSDAQQKFGRLPYLLKVLDVKDMLSIQVHPSKKSAEEGFDKEEALGVARNASNRNYKDQNHKPELMLALSEFYLLHGFRSPDTLNAILHSTPELTIMVPLFADGNYRRLYEYVMNLPQPEVNAQLQPLLDRLIPLYHAGKLSKEHPDFWAARAALTYQDPKGIDRGIYSVYFFNLVKMKKGEAIFQDAGLPHAYLEGQNIEIMANSDNVLRGGLTNKYIDLPELMRHINFEATIPTIIDPLPDSISHERVFATPAHDFELSEIKLKEGEHYEWNAYSVEIALVFEGEINAGEFVARSGEALVAMAGSNSRLQADSQSVIYKATVPYSQS